MKILISPAKSLDFENEVETSHSSNPLFGKKAKQINNVIKDLDEQTRLHFVLENLILNKKAIFKWRKDYIQLSKLSKHYKSFTKMY